MRKITIRKESIIILLLLFFLIAIFLQLKYTVLAYPIILFFYLVYRQRIVKDIPFLFVMIYMLLSIGMSFIYNETFLVLMDSKIFFILFLYYISYLMGSRNVIRDHTLVKPVVIISVVLLLSSIFYKFGIEFVNRADIGGMIVVLLPLYLYLYIGKKINQKILFILIGVGLISLIILGGRTSLFSYLSGIILISLYYKKLNLNLNKIFLGIALLLAIILVIVVIVQRGGGDAFIGDQARYLAAFIFVNIFL